MYKKILVPTDGSALSQKAVEHGVALARDLGAIVTFTTVTSPFHMIDREPRLIGDMPEEYQKYVHDYLTAETDSLLQTAKAVADAADVTCETFHVQHDQVYQGIIDTAALRECDLIVMASHGRRGLSAIVLGSETTKVLTHSDIPVLVYR